MEKQLPVKPLKTNLYLFKRADNYTVTVTVNDYPLHLRQDVRNLCETFEAGYGGSGPAQLALAILCHEYGVQVAQDWYQQFKWQVIAYKASDEWQITSDQIHTALVMCEMLGY